MGPVNINSGVRSGLWDAKHAGAMGMSVFLFGWCVTRQTTQRHGEGLVLRGKPISYAQIAAETGFPESTLRKWMRKLVAAKYLDVKYTVYKLMVIRVLKAKKFPDAQRSLFAAPALLPVASFPRENPQSYRPSLDVIPSQNGRSKERSEFDRQTPNTKTTAQNARRANPPPQPIPKKQKLQPQQIRYAQVGELIQDADRLRRSGVTDGFELTEELKQIAARRGIPDYGTAVARALDVIDGREVARDISQHRYASGRSP